MKMTVMAAVILGLWAIGTEAADSPVGKGSSIVGGSFSFMQQSGDLYESNGDALTTTMVVLPLGRFVGSGFMIGGEFNFLNIQQGSSSITAFSFGPAIGFYFDSGSEQDGSASRSLPYLRVFYFYRSLSNGSVVTGSSAGLRVGTVLMMSRAVGFDLGLSYIGDREKQGDWSDRGTTLLVSAGITTFVW